MKQRMLSLLMTLSILLGFGVPAIAVDTGFSDVAAEAYYADAVEYCRTQGLMNGTSDATFSPDMATSRAQLTAILWRQAGSPPAESAPFSDVPAGAYYAAAAAWASEQGIVSGYSDGRFAPDDPITRARPEISGSVASMDQYDTIFVGYPIWWGQAPKIVYTFLESYDLSGKTIVPFCTSGSSGMGGSAEHLHPLAPSAVWQDGTRFAGGTNRSAVTNWVNTLHLNTEADTTMPKLTIQVGAQSFTATLEDSDTTRALLTQLPVTVTMEEMNGNEKFYYLPQSLPTQSQRPGTLHTGDLMLYGSDCLVLFYKTFSSSYSYTRLSSIDDPTGLTDALGRGSVEVTFRAG